MRFAKKTGVNIVQLRPQGYGRKQRVIDAAAKYGILERPFTPMNWATKVDMKTGRPVETALARYDTTPVLLSPGPGGAQGWNGQGGRAHARSG